MSYGQTNVLYNSSLIAGQPTTSKENHLGPKHPSKVHVWAGISAKGATSVVIFTGILTATRYTDIFKAALIPFIEEHYPEYHRFQQDNDPKHTSRWSQNYFEQKSINWWRTPPSSPDLNQIENVWGSMKNYLCAQEYRRAKSRDKSILENTNPRCM